MEDTEKLLIHAEVQNGTDPIGLVTEETSTTFMHFLDKKWKSFQRKGPFERRLRSLPPFWPIVDLPSL